MLQNFYMFRLHIVGGVVEFVRMGIESTGCREFATGESKLKKLLWIGLLLSLSTGCGRGWLPCLSRGASCGNGSCIGAAPALPQGCNACIGGGSAGYGSYDSDIGGGDYYGGGTIVGDNYVGGQVVPNYSSGTITGPAMQGLPAPAP